MKKYFLSIFVLHFSYIFKKISFGNIAGFMNKGAFNAEKDIILTITPSDLQVWHWGCVMASTDDFSNISG
jgi:hypothetical protein